MKLSAHILSRVLTDVPPPTGMAAEIADALLAAGGPYVVDVRIARQHAGADSDFHDFFSVARLQSP